jgi:dihydrofolate reductase
MSGEEGTALRKVFAFELVTSDGLFEGQTPWSLDWHNVGPEFNDFVVPQMRGVDTLLFGRRTYEGMAGYWPTEVARTGDPVVARLMNDTPKVVFSKTLAQADWENTRIVRGDIGEEVRRLKGLPGRDIAIQGSSGLTVSMLRLGLVDELRLMVNPVVLGAGRRLFEGLDIRLPLRLLDTGSARAARAENPVGVAFGGCSRRRAGWRRPHRRADPGHGRRRQPQRHARGCRRPGGGNPGRTACHPAGAETTDRPAMSSFRRWSTSWGCSGMRKLVETTMVTLGAEVGSPHVWGPPYLDADHVRYQSRLLESAGALLLGRRTYEGFSRSYPGMTGAFADRMNAIPKYVVSTSLREVAWNATLIGGDVADQVAALKAAPGDGTLLKYGTGPLDRLLLAYGLIDEIHLEVAPVAVGTGQRLFEDLADPPYLQLMDVQRFASGVVMLVYAPQAGRTG